MTARMRRISSDYEQVRKDFAGHKFIIVEPIGEEPPEKYLVTYYVNGIYMNVEGKVETLAKHQVEITLHADYPRYKPLCRILTPIWHPNFKDGQVCIGDIWGAGESLSDIIVNIGDMIQYKSWNSFSPLSADAAQWAMDNKEMFPIGDGNLYVVDSADGKDGIGIDIQKSSEPQDEEYVEITLEDEITQTPTVNVVENDFEITAEELEGIEFIPTADRMQGGAAGGIKEKAKVNFKTILTKGILWALIGSILAFGFSELTGKIFTSSKMAEIAGYKDLAKYLKYSDLQTEYESQILEKFKKYCEKNGYDVDDMDVFEDWVANELDEKLLSKYQSAGTKMENALYDTYCDEFDEDMDLIVDAVANMVRLKTAVWAAVIAMLVGLFLGVGEGVFYGSKSNAVKYGLIGAVISLIIGGISGYLAQWMYATALDDNTSDVMAALIRGIGWSIMGIGIGLAIGLIKPNGKRILYCTIGGFVGAFLGGFAFNYVCDIVPNDFIARAVAIIIMCILIGIGVGLLEQFAKQAWLKVVRGEFEGKEYLVFPGNTSIGNNSNNTIVLFKDKLIGAHHCDIICEGNTYSIIDCGAPGGTLVNGMKISRHGLKRGDTISIGNSMLVFNSK